MERCIKVTLLARQKKKKNAAKEFLISRMRRKQFGHIDRGTGSAMGENIRSQCPFNVGLKNILKNVKKQHLKHEIH